MVIYVRVNGKYWGENLYLGSDLLLFLKRVISLRMRTVLRNIEEYI